MECMHAWMKFIILELKTHPMHFFERVRRDSLCMQEHDMVQECGGWCDC